APGGMSLRPMPLDQAKPRGLSSQLFTVDPEVLLLLTPTEALTSILDLSTHPGPRPPNRLGEFISRSAGHDDELPSEVPQQWCCHRAHVVGMPHDCADLRADQERVVHQIHHSLHCCHRTARRPPGT